ncbi:hypothetical protein [Verrucomicrobium sp. BvORR034]|uniref:hypothetical protein n=1 Tax=Verrucomicrobium sp. BvORR034 TaxID=1396418 RepID=UPI00067992DC|nr:hypothetical protein [Verrucomicrobium sp. BvORR034]
MKPYSLPTVVTLSDQEIENLKAKGILLEKHHELPPAAYFVRKPVRGQSGQIENKYLMEDEVQRELMR